jgi:hypothetical protein
MSNTPGMNLSSEIVSTLEELSRGTPDIREPIAKLFFALAAALRKPPLAGRPRLNDVTEALKLQASGVSAKEIYRRLGKGTAGEQRNLREAMRQRRRREKQKRDKLALSRLQNAGPICPSGAAAADPGSMGM